MSYLSIYITMGTIFFVGSYVKERHRVQGRLAEWPDSTPDVFEDHVLPLFVCGLAGLLWPVTLVIVLLDISQGNYRHSRGEAKKFAVSEDHLQAPMTVTAIEALEIVEDPLGTVPALPFGHLHDAWTRFLSSLGEPLPEIWSFSADWTNKWDRTEYRAGYVAVDEGVPGSYFLTEYRDVGVDSVFTNQARGEHTRNETDNDGPASDIEETSLQHPDDAEFLPPPSWAANKVRDRHLPD